MPIKREAHNLVYKYTYNREIGKVCLETRDDVLEVSCSSDGMLNGSTLSSPGRLRGDAYISV